MQTNKDGANTFGLQIQPCKTTRYTINLIVVVGGVGGGGMGEEKEPLIPLKIGDITRPLSLSMHFMFKPSYHILI